MWRLLGFGVVLAAVAAPNNQVPKTGFSCEGRTTGYYADVESGCQVYHMCDGLGRQFSYTCPNATLFQQRMLICDHWYMVNCSKSVDDYTANLRIGHKEMPFVDDNEANPYHRTPRPDLLSHPSQSEYDIIYRTGRAQLGTNLNLVGAESDPKNSTTSTTDEPAYSLPSHWSTEYNKQVTTTKPKPAKKGKPTTVRVNYQSNYKATTPVFPQSVEVTEAPDLELVPPSGSTESSVNFESRFKATTPVFPLSVDVTEAPNLGLLPPLPYQLNDTKPNENLVVSTVNFESKFKATTPVYPKSVELTSEEPSEVGVLPPKDTNSTETDVVPPLSIDFEPPVVDSNFKPGDHSEEIPPELPSKFYQPPKFEPDYTELAKLKGGFKALSSGEWEDLRKKFLIPDYEFPLETVSRPSYDSVLSSFQVGPVPSEKE
ncbi:cuticular protein analogous to peritrophins 1-C precursor [Tribolium castaneum]|uniref:Cuticular protein analogous to peritrophins 1-C n=1 Tax=Tribolium castaneum TaxID=7070 RepID=D1MAH7_TRICA|nr:cuticular protein analogous to peritrophins 1-C precursor [Tribolium castaneum]ACY95468.1 cuticular protein analogous to peritrophins 1-C [Tribolium castaneum]EEZ97929.1 hypothetical protein TcasGA2_TC000316 [Tribolium castaneum]|eukprot:NP_001161905.1 cuticular protein analogous to peritrophins 1-C precursor [Tribolium castaneum]